MGKQGFTTLKVNYKRFQYALKRAMTNENYHVFTIKNKPAIKREPLNQVKIYDILKVPEKHREAFKYIMKFLKKQPKHYPKNYAYKSVEKAYGEPRSMQEVRPKSSNKHMKHHRMYKAAQRDLANKMKHGKKYKRNARIRAKNIRRAQKEREELESNN